MLCATKQQTGKGMKQDCMKRSLVYETWCMTCLEAEEKAIDSEDIEEDAKAIKKKKIRIHKYIGETSRSAFERGLEHLTALDRLEEDSHMLKHIVDKHRDREVDEIKFGMKVVSYTRSPLERQVLESVKIQEERKRNLILNSKAEYSRCTLPRLTSKMGEKEYDKLRSEEKLEEKRLEDLMKTEILRRKKERCKRRNRELHDHKDAAENSKVKRRKLNR